MNLFLVGYSSGNIYMYDVNNQSQATVAPTYTKHIQTESYSVFLNTHSSSSSSTSDSSSSVNTSLVNSSSSTKNSTQLPQITTNVNSTNHLDQQSSQLQKQLTLSNLNQPVQVAKNPLV